MTPPKRQSVSRRGFIAAMVSMSAAAGAFALFARATNAAPASASSHGEPLGSTDRTTSQRAGDAAHAAQQTGENTMLDQMTTAAQGTAIRPFVIDVPDADIDD